MINPKGRPPTVCSYCRKMKKVKPSQCTCTSPTRQQHQHEPGCPCHFIKTRCSCKKKSASHSFPSSLNPQTVGVKKQRSREHSPRLVQVRTAQTNPQFSPPTAYPPSPEYSDSQNFYTNHMTAATGFESDSRSLTPQEPSDAHLQTSYKNSLNQDFQTLHHNLYRTPVNLHQQQHLQNNLLNDYSALNSLSSQYPSENDLYSKKMSSSLQHNSNYLQLPSRDYLASDGTQNSIYRYPLNDSTSFSNDLSQQLTVPGSFSDTSGDSPPETSALSDPALYLGTTHLSEYNVDDTS